MEGNWECLHRTVKRAPMADGGEAREGRREAVGEGMREEQEDESICLLAC